MKKTTPFLLAILFLAALTAPARAFGRGDHAAGSTPINDLGAGLYLGQFQGGLYPGGLNTMPAAHAAEGAARAAAVAPLDTAGVSDPNGKIVLLSIGMSNAMMEFCGATRLKAACRTMSFSGQAVLEPLVDRRNLFIVNGAKGGQQTNKWIDPQSDNYDDIRDNILTPQALSEQQVQVVWMKHGTIGPVSSLPNANADAYRSLGWFGEILRTLKIRYPNLQMVFVSSRTYAGYAVGALSPEPFAYEYGFSTKWLIEAQIDQMNGAGIDPLAGDLDYNTVAPWVAWGPYLWADGLNPRSDGLIWEPSDFIADGVHPSWQGGVRKVGDMMMDFFTTSPFTTPWFLGTPGNPGSVSGSVSLQGRSDQAGVLVAALLWNSPAMTVTTGLDGAYQFAVPPGEYRVTLDMPGYLRTEIGGVDVPDGGAVALPGVGLYGGDVNDDGLVDSLDLNRIAAAYDMDCGDLNWDPAADLNADCLVNIQDMSIASGNYGLTEPVMVSITHMFRRQSYLLKRIPTRP